MRYDSLRMKYNKSNFHIGDPVEVQLRSKGYDMLMKHILLYKTELLRMYIHFDQIWNYFAHYLGVCIFCKFTINLYVHVNAIEQLEFV